MQHEIAIFTAIGVIAEALGFHDEAEAARGIVNSMVSKEGLQIRLQQLLSGSTLGGNHS